MPGPRNRTVTDPSLNHPLTMFYMGAGSGWEKSWGAGIFTLPCRGRVGGRRPPGWGLRRCGIASIGESEIGACFAKHIPAYRYAHFGYVLPLSPPTSYRL